MKNVHENLLSLVGNTPMVRLNRIFGNLPATVYAKLECFNPGHSTKDRIALHIIENAERKGLIKENSVIVETTSGNTGFSVAMVSVIKGYRSILAVSDKTKPEKIAYLQALGAEVYVCPANVLADDPRSYYEVAKRIASETPNSVYINQYFNELNLDAHYTSTGPEIWEQTEGKITHLFACTGTGGTISGSAKYLKEKNPEIKIIGVDAEGSVLKGYFETGKVHQSDIKPYQIEGMGKNLIPAALDFGLIDHFERITDEDAAYQTRNIAQSEGIFPGYTSGAVTQAILQYAEKNPFKETDVVVCIYPDHGSRYMSKVFSDEWMAAQHFDKNPVAHYPEIHVIE